MIFAAAIFVRKGLNGSKVKLLASHFAATRLANPRNF
jgi:hypothetical protein